MPLLDKAMPVFKLDGESSPRLGMRLSTADFASLQKAQNKTLPQLTKLLAALRASSAQPQVSKLQARLLSCTTVLSQCKVPPSWLQARGLKGYEPCLQQSELSHPALACRVRVWRRHSAHPPTSCAPTPPSAGSTERAAPHTAKPPPQASIFLVSRLIFRPLLHADLDWYLQAGVLSRRLVRLRRLLWQARPSARYYQLLAAASARHAGQDALTVCCVCVQWLPSRQPAGKQASPDAKLQTPEAWDHWQGFCSSYLQHQFDQCFKHIQARARLGSIQTMALPAAVICAESSCDLFALKRLSHCDGLLG